MGEKNWALKGMGQLTLRQADVHICALTVFQLNSYLPVTFGIFGEIEEKKARGYEVGDG